MRGLSYGKPVTYMREYLAAMKAAGYNAPRPPADPPVLLAANNRRCWRWPAQMRTAPSPTLSRPNTQAEDRSIVGEDKWVCAEQAVMHETDPSGFAGTML